MIVVTGAAGFIGSCVIAALEADGAAPVVAVDWLGTGDKWRNIAKRQIAAFVKPEDLAGYLDRNATSIEAVVHMGAISDTTEMDVDQLVKWNIEYSVSLWDWCARAGKPLVYASSAATYGGREANLDDDDAPAALAALRPLNPYGWSKKVVDDIFAHRAASGAARNQRAGQHDAARRGHNVATDNVRRRIIRAFDQNIGSKRVDQLERCVLIEHHNRIHHRERPQKRRAVRR